MRKKGRERNISVGGNLTQGVLISGDHNVINLLVEGINTLPTYYAARIQNFLTEYLGTPTYPVPFGGRDADFALLNQWLDNPDAPPYLLFAARAGRGKSALLTRWSVQLLARSDIDVVFFPVSVRFRTNLSTVVFASLAAHLASFWGEKKGGGPHTPTEVWRGVMTEYLTRPLPNGKKLIVIVDGIDEAAGWEAGPDLFPTVPPKGLRIILSARYRSGDTNASTWLRTVGWERPGLAFTPDLSPLTPSGIADVLHRMGFPLDDLGKRVDILAELHRLSEGDPLLVRLYVDDLWARGKAVARLSPEDLQTIPKGLEGYFSRWWDDQLKLWDDKVPIKEPVVQAVLNLLSCALGPLDQADILRLAPLETNLNTWSLEEVLRDLQRFVIGDGRQQGYTFSHPRLKNYFYERFTKQERQDWEEKFLQWGTETVVTLNSGELLPKDVASYVVQYYGSHLERGNPSSAQVLSLASKGWKQAWEAIENSYAGFLNDVDRTWHAAEHADTAAIQSGALAPNIAVTVRCALCHASIHSLAGNIPPALLEQLVAKNIWSAAQGFTYACHITNPKQQAEAISRLAQYLPEPLRYEAVRVIQRINHSASQTEALISFLPHLPENVQAEIAQIALKQIFSIRNEALQARGIIVIAEYLPFALLQEALQAAQQLKDPFSRTQALTGIARHFPKEWQGQVIHEALDAAEKIEDDVDSVEALTELAPYVPERLLRRIFRAALRINGFEATFIDALETLAPYLAKSKVAFDDALKAARRIKNIFDRIDALSFLAVYGPLTMKEEIRQEIARSISVIDDKPARAMPLIRLAQCSSEKDQNACISQALTAARAIPISDERARVLTKLIPYLPEDLREVVSGEAFAAAKESNVPGPISLLVPLFPYLSESLLQDALETITTSSTPDFINALLSSVDPRVSNKWLTRSRQENILAQPLQDLARYLKPRQLEDMLQMAKNLRDEILKGNHLAAIAPHLSSLQLQEAIAITQAVNDRPALRRTSSSLLSHLPEDQQQQASPSLQTINYRLPSYSHDLVVAKLPDAIRGTVVREALRTALMIKDEETQVKALAEIVPHLPKEIQEEMWRLTVRKMWSIENEEKRRIALKMIFPLVCTETVRNEILHAALKIKNKSERVLTLTTLIPFLSEDQKKQIVPDFMQGTQSLNLYGHPIDREYTLTKILTALASHLPEACKEEALRISRSFESQFTRVATWAALVPVLAQDRRKEVLQEALNLARSIEFDDTRAAAIMLLLPHLIEPDQSISLNEALQAAQEIDLDFRRSNTLSVLSPYLTRLSGTKLYPLWSQLLHFLTRRTRRALVRDLHALWPVIGVLGGSKAIRETAREVYEINNWW